MWPCYTVTKIYGLCCFNYCTAIVVYVIHTCYTRENTKRCRCNHAIPDRMPGGVAITESSSTYDRRTTQFTTLSPRAMCSKARHILKMKDYVSPLQGTEPRHALAARVPDATQHGGVRRPGCKHFWPKYFGLTFQLRKYTASLECRLLYVVRYCSWYDDPEALVIRLHFHSSSETPLLGTI